MDDPADHTPDYGASFADVYDDWYQHVTDAEATARRVAELADASGGNRVLELGVGSGRLALPIAGLGCEVVGIDSSPAMLEQLRSKPGSDAIQALAGDMADADQLAAGPFDVVLIAFNTLFNVDDVGRQARCLAAAAALLAPDGSLLVEAAVPASPPAVSERGLSAVRVELDRVVLSATEHDPRTQIVTGQHIDITEGGVRLRPWRIRYLHPDELDELAAGAGLGLVERHADWAGSPFTPEAAIHVSRYGLLRP